MRILFHVSLLVGARSFQNSRKPIIVDWIARQTATTTKLQKQFFLGPNSVRVSRTAPTPTLVNMSTKRPSRSTNDKKNNNKNNKSKKKIAENENNAESSSSSSSSPSSSSLRTSHEVMNRLRWDNEMQYRPDQVLVGYEDRIKGPMERLLADFQSISKGGEIPEHRIWYVRLVNTESDSSSSSSHHPTAGAPPRDADFLWDRRSRVDRLFIANNKKNKNNNKAGPDPRRDSIDPETLQAATQAYETMIQLEKEHGEMRDLEARNRAAPIIRRQLAAQAFQRFQAEDEQSNNNNNNTRTVLHRHTNDVRQQLEGQSIHSDNDEVNGGAVSGEDVPMKDTEGIGGAGVGSLDTVGSFKKKRRFEESLLQSISEQPGSMVPRWDHVNRIRLEAIFHPKFENENERDRHVRSLMKEKVARGEGHLEVSLKHSGSLLLWSGGQRYYSKNSMDNKFTHVGEILLRQHFIRSYWEEDVENNNKKEGANLSDTIQSELRYQACSQYVEAQRLTLAFEVVTAVLGDHGDVPTRDFLILTAVADRSRECFYSTRQVVELAQRFRLPHNDFWEFSSPTSTDALFRFYDNCRETSLAPFVQDTLTKAAENHVCSLYPHVDFQGNILEGIVIRFVSRSKTNPHHERQEENAAGKSSGSDDMSTLAQVARDLLDNQVPSRLPDCFDLVSGRRRCPPWLSANVRQLYAQTRSVTKDESPESFAATVQRLLDKQPNRRKGIRLSKTEIGRDDVPSIVRHLVDSDDVETRRIARVIQLLSKLNIRVHYSIIREELAQHGFSRWLCIVHVLLDQSHQKYRNNMGRDDMTLFRGFALELSTDKGFSANERTHFRSDGEEFTAERDMGSLDPDTGLMLKMKFLPYMVRTFGCRNGLKSLKVGGQDGFVRYTSNLLTKWRMSIEARKQWMPFFRAWARYAEPRLAGRLEEDGQDMEPLTSDNYLEHLEKFIVLYEAGHFTQSSDSFKGVVIVVGPDEDTASMAADFVAQKVGCKLRYKGSHFVPNDHGVTNTHEGYVCSVSAGEDSPGRFRNLLKDCKSYSSFVYYGCSLEDITSVLDGDEKMTQCTHGRLNGWRKLESAYAVDLPLGSLPIKYNENAMDFECEVNKTAVDEMLQNIMQIQVIKANEEDLESTNSGLLVFFPQIPGCGKSSLINDTTEKKLRDFLSGRTDTKRNLTVRMGDKTGRKYWSIVKNEKLKDISGLYVADKNVPYLTWPNLAGVCAETLAIGVPVIPENALKTTVIEGFRSPRNGEIITTRSFQFPFSLSYLAVCMQRASSRPPGTHPGKLDSSTERACMIVIMFYCLYKNVSSDDFLEILSSSFGRAGAILAREPIEVPFFRSDEDKLPMELKELLVEAIRAFCGYKNSNVDIGKLKDEYLDDLELRLRNSLEESREFLNSLTYGIEESQQSFFEQIQKAVAKADSGDFYDMEQEEYGTSEKLSVSISKAIDYVSIDVSVDDVHESLLMNVGDERLNGFWKLIAGNDVPNNVLRGNRRTDKQLKYNTHVTLAHKSERSQDEMRQQFGALEGQGVGVTVTGILWDDRTAALAVQLPNTTNEGSILSVADDKFTHITLWCQDGTSAFRSNELPALVPTGKANRADFTQSTILDGKLIL